MADSPLDRNEERFGGDIGREALPRGARTLSAILPNGRTVWLRVASPLVPASELRRLADAAAGGGRSRHARARALRRGIERLARQLAADAERLTESRLTRAERVRERLIARHHALDRRITKSAVEFRARVAAQIDVERETVRRMGRRDVWDKIVIVTSLLLFAAYGQRGKPFGTNNLTLLIALLIWLVGDELADAIFRPKKESRYPLRDADAWSYIAPAGNLLAGWWLMSGQQHERFVVGFTSEFTRPKPPTLTATGDLLHVYVAEVAMSRVVAEQHFEDFQTFRNVPAVATIRSAKLTAASTHIESVTATVNEVTPGLVTRGKPGILTLTVTVLAPDPLVVPVPDAIEALEVAWMVDTQDPELSKTT